MQQQVIIGAPSMIEDDLLRTFNISLVVRGSITETRGTDSDDARCVLKRGALSIATTMPSSG